MAETKSRFSGIMQVEDPPDGGDEIPRAKRFGIVQVMQVMQFAQFVQFVQFKNCITA